MEASATRICAAAASSKSTADDGPVEHRNDRRCAELDRLEGAMPRARMEHAFGDAALLELREIESPPELIAVADEHDGFDLLRRSAEPTFEQEYGLVVQRVALRRPGECTIATASCSSTWMLARSSALAVPIAHSLPKSALLAKFRSVATLSLCFMNDAARSRTFRVIKATGGKVVEIARLPLNTADISSALPPV